MKKPGGHIYTIDDFDVKVKKIEQPFNPITPFKYLVIDIIIDGYVYHFRQVEQTNFTDVIFHEDIKINMMKNNAFEQHINNNQILRTEKIKKLKRLQFEKNRNRFR